MSLDKTMEKVVSSVMMFSSAEQAGTRPKFKPSEREPQPATITQGVMLGLIAGIAVMFFIIQPQLTGNVVQEPSEPVQLFFSTTQERYTAGEKIGFTYPQQATASIAYLRSDGGIVMLEEPFFVTYEPGYYTFNAVISLNNEHRRFTYSVQVTA